MKKFCPDCKSIRLNEVPDKVYDMLLDEQVKIRKIHKIGFSLERVIYKLLSELARKKTTVRKSEFKPKDLTLEHNEINTITD